jgi:hypothetical protein
MTRKTTKNVIKMERDMFVLFYFIFVGVVVALLLVFVDKITSSVIVSLLFIKFGIVRELVVNGIKEGNYLQ